MENEEQEQNPGRQKPKGDYSKAPKNMRNFVNGKMLRQGIIEGIDQTTANTAQIIKFFQSKRFNDKIKAIIGG